MSDMRFVIIGIGLVFAGFIILGGFGDAYRAATIESNEFGTCYEYSDSAAPLEIDCSFKIFDQVVFFGIVAGLIAGGIIALLKGARGNWDSKIKSKDMVGPGNSQNEKSGKD